MTHKLNTTLIFILLLTLQLSAQQPTLLYDIKPGTAAGIESNAATMAGGKYFFHGKTAAEGQELWVTDGTSAGTHLVKDIDPGVPSSTGGGLIAFKDKVWFKADDSNAGSELWSSDGTEAGTTVIDVAPGSDDSNPGHLAAGTDFLYFTAYDNSFTRGLYRTDGTSAGTVLITTELGPTPVLQVLQVVTVGNVAFIALDGPTASQLWKSDGTAAGTVLVKDLASVQFGWVKNLTPIGDKLYFAGSATFSGEFQPWISDGTTAGTTKLKDIHPAKNADPKWFTEFKGNVYFHAMSTDFVKGLWRTDGTTTGTNLFKDIAISAFSNEAYNMAADANYLYFSGSTSANGRELWRTDGTVAGTIMVKDLDPGFWDANPEQFSLAGGKLYFRANVGGNGVELCKSDGTEPGTVQVSDFFPMSSMSSNPHNIRQIGNNLVFMANHPTYGLELFQLNLTSNTSLPQPVLALQVSPNPASDLVTISLPSNAYAEASQLRLFSGSGELVREQAFLGSEVKIAVKSLSPGLYWVEYRTGSSWGRQKLMVVR